MTAPNDAPGRRERELAHRLVSASPEAWTPALRFGPMDLRSSAEHLLYTALRQPTPDSARPSVPRALGRIARAVLRARPRGRERDVDVVAFVTRDVHVTLFEPVRRVLAARGLRSLCVDAETRASGAAAVAGADVRLAASLRRSDAVRLAAHALAVHARVSGVPVSWTRELGEAEAARLRDVLLRGLPLTALDLARIEAVLEHLQPRAVVCFSESGLLARQVPTAARRRGIPAIDLPHAEAADPWGTTGAGYDAFAVYGPRSREALAMGGIPTERVVEIGPLRYDALLGRPPATPSEDPRRILFASQPADSRRPATHPDVKRAALSAARAAATALAPAELIVVPHPIEPAGEAESFVSQLPRPGPEVRVERELGLHDLLADAWLLVTASSQSVFEAVLGGVPAMTVNPTAQPDPVTFAAEGIAIGVRTDADAAAEAAVLLDPAARAAAVARARVALGDRIGPLDGRAAERAAELVVTFVSEAHGGRPTAARR